MFRTTLLLAFLGLATVAVAQDTTAVETALQKASTATPEEMQAFAAQAVAQVNENAKVVAELTEQARNRGEFKIQNCLTPKNTSAQALVQVTELSSGNLARFLGEGTDEGVAKARHEYRKIAVSLSKSETIRAEALQCRDGEGDGAKPQIVDVVGGTGSDSDTLDPEVLDELDIQIDAPAVTQSEP